MSQSAVKSPAIVLRECWHSARYYRGWILLATLALGLIGLTVIALLPDYYESTTTILVDPQKISEKYVTPTVTTDPNQRLDTITQQVLSASRLQEIIDRFKLYADKRRSRSQQWIIEKMREDITMQVKRSSTENSLSSFTIVYQGRTATVVAEVTRQLASSFIEWNLKNREQQTEGTTEFLNAQLQQTRRDLAEQEQKLREFKLSHLGEMPEQEQANQQELLRLQVMLQANADALNRLDVQRTVFLRTGEDPLRLSPSAPPTERARLEQRKRDLEQQVTELSTMYTPGHPDVRDANLRLRVVNEDISKLPSEHPEESKAGKESAVQLQVINREMQRLTQEQKQLIRQIDSYQAKVMAIPVREQQVAALTRNYQSSKANYLSLLDKTFSADMAADLEKQQQGERFMIIDPARVPDKPSKPHRLILMAAVCLAAFGISTAAAISLDQLNPSIKKDTELDAIVSTSAPLLAVVPRIETALDRRRRLHLIIIATGLSLLACLLEAGLFWKLHPIL